MKHSLYLFLWVAALVVAVSIAAPDKAAKDKKAEEKRKKTEEYRKRKISVSGQYVLKTDPDNEDLAAYMKAMEMSDESQEEIRKNKKVLVAIRKLNQSHWHVERMTENSSIELIFESGKEFEGKLPDGREKPTTITIDDNNKRADRVIVMDGFNSTHDIEFHKTGFNITLTAKDATTKLAFTRWNPSGAVKDVLKAFKEHHFGRGDDVRKNKSETKKRTEFTIAGEYVLETDPDNPDLIEYMNAMDYSEETQDDIKESKKVMVQITKLNKTHWNIVRITKTKTWNMTFVSGKEFQAKLPGGKVKNTTIIINDKSKKLYRLIEMGEFNVTHVSVFFKYGFNVTLKAKSATAKLEFSRWKADGLDNIVGIFDDYFSNGGKGRKVKDEKKGVLIPGDYVLETDPNNDNLTAYMKAMDYSEDTQERIRETKKVMVHIKKLNISFWNIQKITSKKPWNVTFESGKEFEAKLPGGKLKNTTITVDEKECTISRIIKMDGFNATHDIEFSTTGFNITLTAKGAQAKMVFTRWKSSQVGFVEGIWKIFQDFFSGKGNDGGKNKTGSGNKTDEKKVASGPIVGEYVLETNPEHDNLTAYMNAMGYGEDTQDRIRGNKKVMIHIKKLNNTLWYTSKITEKKTWNVTFESGKEFEAKIPGGHIKNTTITIDEKEHTLHRVIKMDGFEATHDVVFTAKGFSITLKAKNATACLEFARWKPKASKGVVQDIADAFKEYFYFV